VRSSPFLLALLFVVGQTAESQVISAPTASRSDLFVFGISGFGAIPMGEFRKHEDGGAGIELMLGYQPVRREALVFRVNGSWLRYGAVQDEGYDERCDPDGGGCWTELVTYNAQTHSMWLFHAGPELARMSGTWRPFAYALAGTTWFNSYANLKPHSPGGPDPGPRNLHNSTNFSTAYALGLRHVGGTSGRAGGWELTVRFTRNSDASYVPRGGAFQRSDGTWVVNARNGAANVLGIHVGYWFGPNVRWTGR
jgi:hypothetical protein